MKNGSKEETITVHMGKITTRLIMIMIRGKICHIIDIIINKRKWKVGKQ